MFIASFDKYIEDTSGATTVQKLTSVATSMLSLKQFDNAYEKYHRAVFRNIAKLVHDENLAEDILQEVFIALWENRDRIHDNTLADWLFTVSFNKSISTLKRVARRNETAMETVEEIILFPQYRREEQEEMNRVNQLLDEGIAKLPERKKAAFILCRIDGKTYDQAAEILGISRHTVKTYLKEATALLRKYILPKMKSVPPELVLLLTFFSSFIN